MTVGLVHRLALTLTVVLPVLGLLSGSSLLYGACLALLGLLAVGVPGLHDLRRSRGRVATVHALTLAGLAFALSVFESARIDAGLIIVMLGLANRFLLRAGQRDDLIIVGASAVLLAAASIVTPGIAFAFIILGFVPSALWAMLTASILGLAEREPDPAARLSASRRLERRPAPVRRGVITGSGIALMLLGYVAVSFLPRFRFGHLLSPGGLVAFSGAGSRMALGTGGVSAGGGGGIVLRISSGSAGSAGELDGLYARVYALDGFDGRNFFDTGGKVEPVPLPGARESARCYDVALSRLVPRGAPHPIAVLGFEGPGPVAIPRLGRFESGTWVSPSVPSAALDVRYQACLGSGGAARPPPSSEPEARARYEARYTALPSNLDPRIPALASELVRGAATREGRIERVLAHFDRGFEYTLDPIEGESSDPLARFLFEAKAGHCELYAGATAALLRAAGIPARVAAGYYGGWYNRRSRHLELGYEDAHAWVEVLLGGQWRWVDATPEEARARRTAKSLAWIRDLWDALEALWYEHVIDFDEQRRRALLERIDQNLTEGRSWLSESLLGGEGLRFSAGPPGLGVLFGLLALVAAGAALGLRARRDLSNVGRRLRKGLGGAEHPSLPLGVLADAQPEALRGSARRAVAAYEARRFGPADRAPSFATVVEGIRAFEALRRARRARGNGGRSPPR